MDFSKLSMKKIRELIIFTALLAAALWKFEVVIDVLKTIWGILFPFALGGAIAFVINVPMSFLEKMIFGKIKAGKKKDHAVLTITLKSGLKKTVKVNVQKTAVKTKKIQGLSKTLTLKKGSSVKLKPVLKPLTSQQKLTYTSSNKKVVTVSSKGVVKAKKSGKVTITVKSGSKKVKIKVTVK